MRINTVIKPCTQTFVRDVGFVAPKTSELTQGRSDLAAFLARLYPPESITTSRPAPKTRQPRYAK